MRKVWLLLSGLVLAAVLIGAGGCAYGGVDRVSQSTGLPYGAAASSGGAPVMVSSQQQVGLWVTGDGKSTAAPDIVVLSLGIEAQAKSVAQAQSDAANAMDKVMKALKANGVADKDIQTQQFSIAPVRQWIEDQNKEIIIGYRVTNIVIAKIRQVDKAGPVIDAVAQAGGDLTRIDSIDFSIDDPTPYYKEARTKAVKDAMARADQMSQESGVKLGKLLYMSESTPYVPPVIMRDFATKAAGMAPAPAPTPVSPGELEVQVSVQMVYSIE